MVTREKLTAAKLESLFSMLEDDGAAPPGQVNAAHISAVRSAPELPDVFAVADAHKKGNSPPDPLPSEGANV